VVGPGRAELAAAMGPSSVVVPGIFGQDRPQVPFAEDQHPVGDFGPGGEDEPFGIGVSREGFGAGSSRPRWPASARTAPDDAVNWPARSRTRNRKSAARFTEGPSKDCGSAAPSTARPGWRSPRGCARSGCQPPSRTSSTSGGASLRSPRERKSAASIVAAWARRNRRQVVSARRFGGGRDPQRLEDPAIVDAPTRRPSLSSSPWIRWYPSRCSRWRAARSARAISALTGGLPVRFRVGSTSG